MIPIGDDESQGGPFPFINVLLIVINVLVFLFEASLNENALQGFINQWGVIPVQILAGQRLETLFTAMFMHGGWLHLIGNMVFLWVFGDNVEDTLGHIPYLLFYLAGGLAASAAHIMLNPDSAIPSLGASGAIAAVLGAFIVIYPRARIKALIFLGIFVTMTRVSALIFLGIWFATQLLSGFASLDVNTAQTSGVAFWAHIGGFVFGVLIGFFFRGRAYRAPYARY
jgi:membrane associated rhomboid family serine protease